MRQSSPVSVLPVLPQFSNAGFFLVACRIKKAINATCLYRHIDANIEAAGKACFDQCPPDPTRMSDCYLKCYCTADLSASCLHLVAVTINFELLLCTSFLTSFCNCVSSGDCEPDDARGSDKALGGRIC